MARFRLVDLAEGVAAPSEELAAVLEVQAGERLLRRRLQGVGAWDLGRELSEIVIPARLPAGLDYTADADLAGILDRQAPDLPYGEAYWSGLARRFGADEVVTLHRYVDGPFPHPDPAAPADAWDGYRDRKPVGLLVFFPAAWQHRAVSRFWRYAHSWAIQRRQVRRVGPPSDRAWLGPGSADSAAGDIGRVVLDSAVMGGVPCIRGTRIPVVTLLGMLAACSDPASVLGDFPELVPADLWAAVRYAAEMLDRVGPCPPEEVAT